MAGLVWSSEGTGILPSTRVPRVQVLTHRFRLSLVEAKGDVHMARHAACLIYPGLPL